MENDYRYVYSSRCTFHGGIKEAGKNGLLPCCPSCGAPLYEMSTKENWDSSVKEYIKQTKDANYEEFLNSLAKLRPCRSLDELSKIREEFNLSKNV